MSSDLENQEKLRSYSPRDTEWTKYVIDLMEPHEKYNDAPKCIGLRRMVELLIGEIIDSHARVVQAPMGTEEGRCVIEHTIVVRKHGTGDVVKYTDCADGTELNVKPNFYKFLTPVTGTRAEARTLCKLLKLQTVSAEEMDSEIQKEINKSQNKQDDVSKEPAYTKNKLTPNQERVIMSLCTNLKISVQKLLKQQSGGKDVLLKNISDDSAAKLIKYLNGLNQLKTDKEREESIPVEVRI